MADISSEPSSSAGRPPKRLLFDRRYGWIYDEWRDPSEEALAGGRGMFCIVPITKTLLKLASESINFTAMSVRKAFENPESFSPQALQANFSSQINKLLLSNEGFNVKLLKFRSDSSSPQDSSMRTDVF